MKKNHLHQSEHPLDDFPFEALCSGSWQPVESINIRDGTVNLRFLDTRYEIHEKGPFGNVRLRSRKAKMLDCTCFLRPGIDVCVLLADMSREENLEPVWVDAKIDSIERKPHQSRCLCRFYVKLYDNQVPLGSEKVKISKEISIIGIDQISILQNLVRHPSEAEYFRWKFSKDCSVIQKTKLFLGRFLSDLSWLLVSSVHKRTGFDVRSVQNKIVYQISGSDDENYSLNSDKEESAINFKIENNVQILVTVPIVSSDPCETVPACDANENGEFPYSDLRRSKRRYVQPERFLGDVPVSELDIGPIRIGTQKTIKWTEEDTYLALLDEPDADEGFIGKHPEEGIEVDFREVMTSFASKDHVDRIGLQSGNVRIGATKQKEELNQLAIVPLPDVSDTMARDQERLRAGYFGKHSGDAGESSSKQISDRLRMKKRKIYEDELMECDSRWEGSGSVKKKKRIRYYSMAKKNEYLYEGQTFKKRSMAASGYYEVIKTYMKRIESTINEEEPQPRAIDQWKVFQTENCLNPGGVHNPTPSTEVEEEVSETEMLWRELDVTVASGYLLEENEDSDVDDSHKVAQESDEDREKICRHQFSLDEEIGVLCRLCGFVSTEIKDVSPPFLQLHSAGWTPHDKLCTEEDSDYKQTGYETLKLFHNGISSDAPTAEENVNVWALIPALGPKLHFHQKKAFEFLWRNIAGSLIPGLMDPSSKNRGGCVISHTPGAGKTFLIIAFLVSYLKLFPGKRPLVLAPKSTLYTWYKEIIKWKVPVPVYQIHNGGTYRMLKQRAIVPPGVPKPSNDVMHVIDCLDKIRKWHQNPSILIMGYTSFLTLTREDSKYPHRKYMCEVLRKSPGLMILDEGHNPRSTKSRLRKALMKVETDLRILLSGTLFQNNFGEYFNTLCLARPKFVNEVLAELDPKFRRNKKGTNTNRISMENRARKLFLENIGSKVDSSIPEDRINGLNMLKNITNGFIDVYEGGFSDTLPGLQSYTLLMKSTSLQHGILKKLQKLRGECKRFPLELELLITLGAIHPSLIKTAACCDKIFSMEELAEFDKHKHDFRKGSKLKFVVSLVNHCIPRKEKILIFCHNIAPINFLLKIFGEVYNWRKGKEVLVLQGDLELFERGRVMDKFEEVGGPSRVLLASITACAEGVSLTAASRVVLLDSEWNPSKTKQAIARAFRPGQQKMVYVYQLLQTDSMEEEKYDRTTWKEWVSSMIFSEELVEDPSRWTAEKIEDDVLREIVAEDWASSFHMIMKNEKASKDHQTPR